VLATVNAATLVGVEGHPVLVEAHVASGLPAFAIVGLPDAACREARDRVRAAVQSSALSWPQTRITVNLAPSSVPKVGTALDLAVAVGVLVATDLVPAEVADRWAYLGELGLDGSLRPVRGIVPLVAALRERVGGVVVPAGSFHQATLVPGLEIRAADSLATVVRALRGHGEWAEPSPPTGPGVDRPPELADVRGQEVGRKVVEIAAAGGHHLLLSGPPGAGKTLLATRLPGLLPDLDDESALEVTAIHSAAGEPVAGRLLRRPPFRAPHHTASMVSLVGGGAPSMRPGEITLAHRGVLFADELGEFPPSALDALRQPIEEGRIRVSRARGSVSFPARFQLVAATNPCPCGPSTAGCRCTEAGRSRYARRLSGPLLDRFDLRVEVGRPDADELLGAAGEPTALVASRVAAARELARERGVATNASIRPGELDTLAALRPAATRLAVQMVRSGRLTARGLHRIRRVARTVADLDGHHGPLEEVHLATALALRAPVSDPAVAS
jgi:magnesium chelatase family protein